MRHVYYGPAHSDVDIERELSSAGVQYQRLDEDSLVNAKAYLAEALDELVAVLRTPDAVQGIADVDRVNLAKYLTIAKLKLENAIALVRSGEIPD